MRLFVAIALPEEIKKSALIPARDFPRLKWVRPEQMHLTLRFIGEVDSARLSEIRMALARVRFPAFELFAGGGGFFPDERRPQVGWLGCDSGSELLRLQDGIEASLRGAGIAPENRPFLPHVTLLRFAKQERPAVMTALRSALTALPCQSFPVTEFRLYSSVLAPGGAVHTVEAVFAAER